MRAFILAFLVVSSTAIASPAPDVHTGTNTKRETSSPVFSAGGILPEHSELQPTDEALAIGRDMARCVVLQRSKDVGAALSKNTVEDFRRATVEIKGALSDCLMYGGKNVADSSHFQFGPSSLAGLLAEAMLGRNGVPTLAAAKYDVNAPKLDGMAGSTASLVQLRLGECLAQTQPDAVATLVRSAPSSPQEISAFQALVPFIPTCLDKNVTLKATRSSLRLALAFALYRRTIRPVTAGATN